MKILIAYATKTGTTEECAHRLAACLSALSPTVARLGKEPLHPEEYDMVLLGSPIRFGKLLPEMRRFLREQEHALCDRRIGVFLCCAFSQDFDRYYETLFPESVRARAFTHLNFGSSLRREGLSLFDRLMVRAMRSYLIESDIEDGEYTPTLPSLLPENIEVMAAHVREEIQRDRRK